MRKYCSHKQLGLQHGLSTRRRAFSLAELVVSIGILVLMMSLAGQVFNITVQSTGQATALTEIMQQLRAFEHTLREDLRGVQPGNSLILIQGNPVNAYWTRSGRDADDNADPSNDTGYPADPERERPDGSGNTVKEAPRADILMIFTARPGASFVEAGTAPVVSNLQQVVYGHAELGEYVPSGVPDPRYNFESATGSNPFFPETPDEYPLPTGVAVVPAAQWHLARRSVLLLPTDPLPPAPPLPITSLDDPRLLECQKDVISNFGYEQQVLRPQLDAAGVPIGGPWFLPAIFGDWTLPYQDRVKPFARSSLDPTPPALFAARIGHYLLPNCASFKVEWTLNPHSEFVAERLDRANEVFWFDPGHSTDPLAELKGKITELEPKTDDASKALYDDLDSLMNDHSPDGSYNPATGERYAYSLSNRFRGTVMPSTPPGYDWDPLAPVSRFNLVVFTATRPGPPLSEPVLDPMFPGALRITIDVFDKQLRLDRPIRHVMTIPIGG